MKRVELSHWKIETMACSISGHDIQKHPDLRQLEGEPKTSGRKECNPLQGVTYCAPVGYDEVSSSKCACQDARQAMLMKTLSSVLPC